MASASGFGDSSDYYYDSENESSASHKSDSDEDSEEESDSESSVAEPCKFYNNKGSCRDGSSCRYLHLCKYALKGNCRYGSKCKLNHPSNREEEEDEEERGAIPKLTDGRYYQWQLNDGNGWMDIDNDHIIEAQYSLPHTRSIKIYNTQYGAVSIDFNKIRVFKKSLRVRRLDDGNTEWIWYCTLHSKWKKYGDKDSKGNPSSVTSAEIEMKFQNNPKSSFHFNVGSETLEIRFGEMRQVGNKKKRKVTRRPLYRQQQATSGVSQATSVLQNVSLGTTPQWQFEGDSGAWHSFKRRSGTQTECSVTSDDIERTYQKNQSGSMSFKVKRDSYKLDFTAMTQTNLRTKHSRNVRRVLV